MIGIPLIVFAAELLLVQGLFKLITLFWPDSFVSRGLVLLGH
jgi:hypothetical protein